VNEELSILCKVQETDTEIERHRQALDALDSGTQLEEEVGAVESELAEIREKQSATEQENLDSELELRTLQEKKERFQGQLYSGAVSNPRQLSDLHREVEMLGREIGKVEDRMLEMMEALESQRAEIATRETRVAELRGDLESVRSGYEDKSARLRIELEEMESQRREFASRVGTQLLKRYEQIRSRMSNLGLVRVTGTTCPGCRIALPSDTVKAMKTGRPGPTCDNCGRMLVLGGSDERDE
jgi:predicted  nucleic acid-binding Zn-ribbon protein